MFLQIFGLYLRSPHGVTTPEEQHRHLHRRENLKSHSPYFSNSQYTPIHTYVSQIVSSYIFKLMYLLTSVGLPPSGPTNFSFPYYFNLKTIVFVSLT
jgi:hypothetical protein